MIGLWQALRNGFLFNEERLICDGSKCWLDTLNEVYEGCASKNGNPKKHLNVDETANSDSTDSFEDWFFSSQPWKGSEGREELSYQKTLKRRF